MLKIDKARHPSPLARSSDEGNRAWISAYAATTKAAYEKLTIGELSELIDRIHAWRMTRYTPVFVEVDAMIAKPAALTVVTANSSGHYNPRPLTVENLIAAADEARRDRMGLQIESEQHTDTIDHYDLIALNDPNSRQQRAQEIVSLYI